MKFKSIALTLAAAFSMLPEAGARESSEPERPSLPVDDSGREAVRDTPRRSRIATAADLLADAQGDMPTKYLHAAVHSNYFMQHMPPLLRHQLQRIASRSSRTIPFASFEPYLEVAARAKASRWHVKHGAYTRVRLAAAIVTLADPTAVAMKLVADWACVERRSCSAAALLGRSTLVREALTVAGSDLITFIRDAEEPLLQTHMVAWTAVAEARFLEGLGVSLDEALTPEQVADLLDDATDRGTMPHGMSGVADQLRADLVHGPASCQGDTMGLAAGPFGACGLPDLAGGTPSGGDPSPIDGAAVGAGRGPTPGMTPSNGGWGVPGSCHGLDPSKIFNGNAGAGQEIQGAPNGMRTYDAVLNAVFGAVVATGPMGMAMNLVMSFGSSIDSVPAVAFPDPVPPEATPEPDTSNSNEQSGDSQDQGPDAPPDDGCADGTRCASEQSNNPPANGGGASLDPRGDGASGLAGFCGTAVASALVGCMFPAQAQATGGGQSALLCNQQAPMDCGFEPCNFACACQNTATGEVCSPAPGDEGPAACADEAENGSAGGCPEECEVLVVAAMVNPGLVAPDHLPPECGGCGVVSAADEGHPCFGDAPMPPNALVPLCGAFDPIWAGAEASGGALPWAEPPAWMEPASRLPE